MRRYPPSMRSRQTSPPFTRAFLGIRIPLLLSTQPSPERNTSPVRLQASNSLTPRSNAGYGRGIRFQVCPDCSHALRAIRNRLCRVGFFMPEGLAESSCSGSPLRCGPRSSLPVYTRTKRGQLLDSYTSYKSAPERARHYFAMWYGRLVACGPCSHDAIGRGGHMATWPGSKNLLWQCASPFNMATRLLHSLLHDPMAM